MGAVDGGISCNPCGLSDAGTDAVDDVFYGVTDGPVGSVVMPDSGNDG